MISGAPYKEPKPSPIRDPISVTRVLADGSKRTEKIHCTKSALRVLKFLGTNAVKAWTYEEIAAGTGLSLRTVLTACYILLDYARIRVADALRYKATGHPKYLFQYRVTDIDDWDDIDELLAAPNAHWRSERSPFQTRRG